MALLLWLLWRTHTSNQLMQKVFGAQSEGELQNALERFKGLNRLLCHTAEIRSRLNAISRGLETTSIQLRYLYRKTNTPFDTDLEPL